MPLLDYLHWKSSLMYGQYHLPWLGMAGIELGALGQT